MQDLGKPFFDRLLGQVAASEDPEFRNSAIGALARVEDPALVRELETAVLADTFKGTEMLAVLVRQMGRPATTEATYAWLRQNADELIARVPEGFPFEFRALSRQPFCSDARADEWRAFIVAHADALPGYERYSTRRPRASGCARRSRRRAAESCWRRSAACTSRTLATAGYCQRLECLGDSAPLPRGQYTEERCRAAQLDAFHALFGEQLSDPWPRQSQGLARP